MDVDLAKSCADLPEDDEEMRKKLWLKIARHVVQEEKDVKKAMNCLSSCNLLKIEDILPFFPDFVTIDHFKVGNLPPFIFTETENNCILQMRLNSKY